MTTFKGLLKEAERINQQMGLSRATSHRYSTKAQNGVQSRPADTKEEA